MHALAAQRWLRARAAGSVSVLGAAGSAARSCQLRNANRRQLPATAGGAAHRCRSSSTSRSAPAAHCPPPPWCSPPIPGAALLAARSLGNLWERAQWRCGGDSAGCCRTGGGQHWARAVHEWYYSWCYSRIVLLIQKMHLPRKPTAASPCPILAAVRLAGGQ